ncbi:MAG TPA: hypothetical protein VM101_04505 [Flavitalea sp.]|nr:hypothetical protein [Flavitalea sp.]
MKKSAILINGVSLPHHVVDKSVQQAKRSKSLVKVVFIYENLEDIPPAFPKNEEVSKADLSDANAIKKLEEVIQHNSSYVESNLIQQEVPHEIVILKNPSIDEIAASLKDIDKIFVDHDTFLHPHEFAYVNFSYEDLEEHIATKIQWCKHG